MSAEGHEPTVPQIIKGSFVFLPSTGMRLAPEVLLLELMREVFYADKRNETPAAKPLDPDDVDANYEFVYSEGERAVINAFRGRRKQTKATQNSPFYAPAYPHLARTAWLRRKSERMIANSYLGGPIRQYLWQGGENSSEGQQKQREFCEKALRALVGHHSTYDQQVNRKDIFSVAALNTAFPIEEQVSLDNLMDLTAWNESIIRGVSDPLAQRIFEDSIAVWTLEKELPRLEWLRVLMTYLRFSMPMWVLAQMKITSLLHTWLLNALEHGLIRDEPSVLEALSKRNRNLLHPILTPTLEIRQHIERYIRHRVELSLLIKGLTDIRPEELKSIDRLESARHGSGVMSVTALLALAARSSVALREHWAMPIRQRLTREAEVYSAWRDPLRYGQGKNIDEFFRVLYRAHEGDEAGGYLLTQERSGTKTAFYVFPGQLLLKILVYLADGSRKAGTRDNLQRPLLLLDLENHMRLYGIDFAGCAESRPRLIDELKALGLLKGSPDAGHHVPMRNPYFLRNRQSTC